MHRRGGKQRGYSFKDKDYELDLWGKLCLSLWREGCCRLAPVIHLPWVMKCAYKKQNKVGGYKIDAWWEGGKSLMAAHVLTPEMQTLPCKTEQYLVVLWMRTQ